tara:strand:- start:565 stop:732 length:168 start_codon:yes stop_codon:yes gene_type:complete
MVRIINNIMTQEELNVKYALYILHESSTPVDEIEWLIQNLNPEATEIVEDILKHI